MTGPDENPEQWLAALEELRTERDDLHPHRPLLDPAQRHLHAVPTTAPPPPSGPPPTDRYLTDVERERGHRRVAELRARIDQMRSPARKDQPS